MCDFGLTLTALSIAASVGSAAAGYMGQQKAANAQQNYQNQVAADQANYKNQVATQANQAFIDQTYQQNLNTQQNAAAASQKAQQVQTESAQARARVAVSAGEAGVSGLSLDSLVSDYYRQEDFAKQNIAMNQTFTEKQAAEQNKGFRSEAISRVSGVRDYIPTPVVHPNPLSSIFDAAGSVTNSLSTYGYRKQIGAYRNSLQIGY